MRPFTRKTLVALAGALVASVAAAAATPTPGPDREVLLASAHASAHQGRLDEAQAIFRGLLASRPDDVAALDGLGYALAWAGRHDEAERTFRRADELAPGHLDAAKGLAYVALWRGDTREAARRFGALTERPPASAEALTGLGQALSAGGRRAEAHDAFARAVALEPARPDALRGLADTAPPGPRGELLLLGGVSRSDGRDEAGLRFAELAFEPAEGSRAWLQYDDSLSLDNVALASGGVRAPAWYLGGRVAWGDGLATRLEGGYRALPEGVSQWLVRAEQEAALGEATDLKVGGWIGPRSDGRTEASLHAGVALALSRQLRLEPVLFLGLSGAAGERELRGLLSAEWAFGWGATLGAGLSAGHTTSPDPAAEGTPVGAFARFAFPLVGGVRGQALLSQERPAVGPDLTLFALGLSGSFGGRP